MNAPLAQNEDRNITIRPFSQEDIPAIYNFLPVAYVSGEVPLSPSTEFSQFEKWLLEKSPGQHRFVAHSDRGVHGLVILTQRLRPRLQHSGTITLLVDTRYRCEDVKEALLRVAIEMADRWLNLGRLQLEIHSSDRPTLDSFKPLGFEVEGRRAMARLVEGKWHDNLLLARIRPGFLPQVVQDEPTILMSLPDTGTERSKFNSLEIRPVRLDDASAFHEMLREPAIDRTTLQLPSIELREVEERLKSSGLWLHRFAAIADTRVVGSISLVQKSTPGYTHIGHIGMKVHRHYWGLGIGTRLVEKITELSDNWLNIVRIELDVNTNNPAGIRLYKKCGFIIEGTKRYHTYGDGRWSDSYFMARIKEI